MDDDVVQDKETTMGSDSYSIILDSLDIVAIAVDLGILTEKQVKGHNYMVSCFNKKKHQNDDKVKSAKIYHDTQQYHCFGCGHHANSIQLYASYNGLNTEQAMKELCKKYNIKIKDIDIKDTRREKKIDNIKEAKKIFM